MKARLPWLAAIPLCWAALIPGAALAAGAPAVWSDLWHTPDQQGQALLDAGNPAAAAARFEDPRRRAYADLEAGRYPQAAKLLAPFTDPRSEYNRGNALAKAGRLQAALAAYDAALKRAPADRDIRHNRDLVERALRQRQSQRSQGKRGARGTASSGQKPSAAGQQSGSGSQKKGSGGSQSSGGSQVASNGSRAGAGHSGKSGQRQTGQSGNSAQTGAAQATGANGSRSAKESPDQARRDAALAAAIAREQRQRGGKGGTGQAQAAPGNGASKSAAKPAENGAPSGDLLAGGTRTPRRKPQTERQLALDQWLRQIPDSPAGLLQRQFLIEHMMKQQDAGGSQEPGP